MTRFPLAKANSGAAFCASVGLRFGPVHMVHRVPEDDFTVTSCQWHVQAFDKLKRADQLEVSLHLSTTRREVVGAVIAVRRRIGFCVVRDKAALKAWISSASLRLPKTKSLA